MLNSNLSEADFGIFALSFQTINLLNITFALSFTHRDKELPYRFYKTPAHLTKGHVDYEK